MISNSPHCSSHSFPSVSPWTLRSSWARGILNKIENDRCLAKIDRTRWYRLSRSNLLDDEFESKFVQFDEDEETKRFLKRSKDKSENVPIQIVQSFLLSFLTLFMTRTSGTNELDEKRSR